MDTVSVVCPDCGDSFARKSSRSVRCPKCQRAFREAYLQKYRAMVAASPACRELLKRQKRESKRRARQHSGILAAYAGGEEF